MSLGQDSFSFKLLLKELTLKKILKYQSVNFVNFFFLKAGTPLPSFSEGEKVNFLLIISDVNNCHGKKIKLAPTSHHVLE